MVWRIDFAPYFGRNWKKQATMISFQMALIMLILCSLGDEQSLRKWLSLVFYWNGWYYFSNDPCTMTAQLKWCLACQSVYGFDYLTELLFNVLLSVPVLRCWYFRMFQYASFRYSTIDSDSLGSMHIRVASRLPNEFDDSLLWVSKTKKLDLFWWCRCYGVDLRFMPMICWFAPKTNVDYLAFKNKIQRKNKLSTSWRNWCVVLKFVFIRLIIAHEMLLLAISHQIWFGIDLIWRWWCHL